MKDKLNSENIIFENSKLSSSSHTDKIKTTGFPTSSNSNKMNMESNSNLSSESQRVLWSSSNGKNYKTSLTDRKRRRKVKEPGVINEYPASAIPNNIGDKPVQELADYVNGSHSKNATKTTKSERKLKAVVENKKPENYKNSNNNSQEKNNNSSISVSVRSDQLNLDLKPSKLETETHNVIEYSKRLGSSLKMENMDEKINLQIDYADNSIDEDDDFYHVVRHKNRNRTKIIKPQNTVNELRNVPNEYDTKNIDCKLQIQNIDQATIKFSEHVINKTETINLNDKENLNWFIYYLWIEFKKNRDKYLKEQNDQALLTN